MFLIFWKYFFFFFFEMGVRKIQTPWPAASCVGPVSFSLSVGNPKKISKKNKINLKRRLVILSRLPVCQRYRERERLQSSGIPSWKSGVLFCSPTIFFFYFHFFLGGVLKKKKYPKLWFEWRDRVSCKVKTDSSEIHDIIRWVAGETVTRGQAKENNNKLFQPEAALISNDLARLARPTTPVSP